MSQDPIKEETDREVAHILQESPSTPEFLARIKAASIVAARQKQTQSARKDAMASSCTDA